MSHSQANPTRRDILLAAASSAVLVSGGIAQLAEAVDVAKPPLPFEPVKIPDWVFDVTRMAFLAPSQVEMAAKAGVQVVHGNAVWPYYPLRKDGGGLNEADARVLRGFVEGCHKNGMKLSLGLPPFPPAALLKVHPEWRIHSADNDAAIKIIANDKDLGTRLPCNLSPWGDYLIDICCELVKDYSVDGYSFDGNYHPAICYCPACKSTYKAETGRALPAKGNLDDIPYREYLVWRDGKLEDHYRKLQHRLKAINPNAVVMTWSVNAGRYGHFLYSPRAMSTRMNRLIDLPMQEWWLDETNFGASVAPAFGAAYIRATTGDRPSGSEAYLMSRGNPYGSDSFPHHERLTRTMLAITNGSTCPQSFGWPGHEKSTADVFSQIAIRDKWTTRAKPLRWAAMLVSEQTRQFYAYKDIAERFLPHVFGAFRVGMEEHLPLSLVNDWDLAESALDQYSVLVLPNSAAMSDAQVEAVRTFVQNGGGLVATGESSLCDQIGRPRGNFALADVFGVSYRGRPKAPLVRPELDANFAISIDENYWKQRIGVATLRWTNEKLLNDETLAWLVPTRSAIFRGPLTAISEPADKNAVTVRMTPEGSTGPGLPMLIQRTFGAGRVAYFAGAVDAALWSYAYPYQRRLLASAIRWAAKSPTPISVKAPMCVQAGYFEQSDKTGRRIVVHLFNGINTAANHGLPSADVPLREETIPIHGIELTFHRDAPAKFHCEPAGGELKSRREGNAIVVEAPAVEIHGMIVGEY